MLAADLDSDRDGSWRSLAFAGGQAYDDDHIAEFVFWLLAPYASARRRIPVAMKNVDCNIAAHPLIRLDPGPGPRLGGCMFQEQGSRYGLDGRTVWTIMAAIHHPFI